MIIELRADDQPLIREAYDLKSLSVRASAATPLESVTPLGSPDPDGEHCWLNVEALRAAADPGGEAGWRTGFEAMISYARSKGWASADGTAVRAHVDRH